MLPLTPALIAAMRSGSARPYLRVTAIDRDLGVARLRWTRWRQGAEPAGPAAAAVAGDGALLRARIDPLDGALSSQRVPAPAADSDYSAWAAIAPAVAVAPGVGLAAAAGRSLLASVQPDGLTIEVRESSDGGVSFGSPAVLATAAGAVTAVCAALLPDGAGAVLYAAGGVVYAARRSALGAWPAPSAWPLSLATVSALAATAQGDIHLLVSGTDGAGAAVVWAVTLGAGAEAPPGVWLGPTDVQVAAAGSALSYRALALTSAGGPRALLTESYGGPGTFDQPLLATGVAGSVLSERLWRDPQPLAIAGAPELLAGAALAARDTFGGEAWLCTSTSVWHAPLDPPAEELTGLVELDLTQDPDGGQLRLVLGGTALDGGPPPALPAALQPGGELAFEAGYHTAGGVEAVSTRRFWIDRVRREHGAGEPRMIIDARDGWYALERWSAPGSLSWAAGESSAFQVLASILRRTGLRLSATDASDEVVLLTPAVEVRPGEQGTAAVRRLLVTLPDLVRMRGTTATLVEPRPDDAPEYAYGRAHDGLPPHPVRALRLDASRARVGRARVFGASELSDVIDAAALLAGGGLAIEVDDNLDAPGRVQARAATVLRRAARVPLGELVAPANPAHEPGDVIEVTDAALGLVAVPYRVLAVRLRWAAGGRAPRYESVLTLGPV